MFTKQEVEDRRKAKRNNGYIRMLSVANARKSISKRPKQREFIGLQKKSSGLASPKDADDVKITFPLVLPLDLSLGFIPWGVPSPGGP